MKKLIAISIMMVSLNVNAGLNSYDQDQPNQALTESIHETTYDELEKRSSLEKEIDSSISHCAGAVWCYVILDYHSCILSSPSCYWKK